MASTSKPDDALSSFTKLAPSIYISEPDTTAHNGTAPTTIVLAFWMNAPARALAKYVLEYKRLAPSARIIFILSSSNDFLMNSSTNAQHARLTPAVHALQASLPAPDTPIYLHLFSNGGVFTSINLFAAYRAATGSPLRLSCLILDSAPGFATVPATMRAFSFILPRPWPLRLLGKLLLWSFVLLSHARRAITGIPDAVSVAREAANNPALVHGARGEDAPPRCYIYSDADELVNWLDIEAHANEAESKGWAVRRERFQGSPHVSHMRADPERYWGVVREYLKLSEVV